MFHHMASPSQPVSFRLSAEAHRQLAQLAAAEGESVGDFVRNLVFERLEERERTLRLLEEVRAEVAHLKSLLALSTEGLLVSLTCTKPMTREVAKAWVDARLRVPRPDADAELPEE